MKWNYPNVTSCDVIAFLRDVMKSQNWLYHILACRCARKMILCLFLWYLSHRVQNCYKFLICIMLWRHDVMSWRHKTWFYLSQACRCARELILFCFYVFHVTEFKNVIDFLFAWWRDVMTSCHDVTKPDLPISASRCARKLILFCFHGFLGRWVQKLYLFFICVMTWRHDVMSWRHKTWFTYLSF